MLLLLFTPFLWAIYLSVYPEQYTGEAYAFLGLLFVLVDCSGEEFFWISIWYSFSARSIIMSKIMSF